MKITILFVAICLSSTLAEARPRIFSRGLACANSSCNVPSIINQQQPVVVLDTPETPKQGFLPKCSCAVDGRVCVCTSGQCGESSCPTGIEIDPRKYSAQQSVTTTNTNYTYRTYRTGPIRAFIKRILGR